MSKRKELALENFNKGYNCAQSIFMAYGDLFDIDIETRQNLTSGFGSGMSGLGETCGTINSAIMILGLKYRKN